MSNLGQAALTIGGFFVGAAFPFIGPSLGFLIGSLAGQILFPTKLPGIKGPRLEELSVQTSTIGASIKIIFGTFASAGNVIWYSGLIESETTTTQGGKGGPEQSTTSYSYSMSIAVGICEPTSTAGIGGIRRIWADAICIYDLRPQDTSESDEDYAARVAATQQTQQGLTIYLGDEAQLPDPTIEAYEGSGNVHPFRGLAYVVFTDFQLERFGNRPPNFRFEVYNGFEGQEECETYAQEVLYPWILGSNDPVDSRNTNIYRNIGGGGGQYSNTSAWIAGEHPSFSTHVFSYKIEGATNHNQTAYPAEGSPGAYEGVRIFPSFNTIVPGTIYDSLTWNSLFDPPGPAPTLGSALGEQQIVWWSGNPSGFGNHQSTGLWYYSSTGLVSEGLAAAPGFSANYAPFNPNAPYYLGKADIYAAVSRAPSPPLGTAGLPGYTAIPGAPNYFIDPSGNVVRGDSYVLDNSQSYHVLQKYTTTGPTGDVTKYPLGPARPVGHVDDTQAFWEAAYADAVTAGDIAGGLTYGIDYPETQAYGYISSCAADSVDTLCVDVADVVDYICQRVGVTADVSDITSCVEGYCVPNPMPGRDMIEPLRMFGLFDAVESGTALKFVERGHAAVATLEEAELAAHVSGSDRPSVIETTRVIETSLPQRLRLKYASPDREYETAEQDASRIATRATQPLDIELPIAMSDTEAAHLAEILLYDLWIARNTYTTSVGNPRLYLEPTDPLIAPVDGQLERMRITGADYSLAGVLKLELVRDDDGTYNSTAVPGTPGSPPAGGSGPGSGLICDSEAILLDLPALRTQDTDAGYYAAIRGFCESWSCAALYRSSDGGTSYQWVGQAVNESTIGTLTDVGFADTAPSIQVSLDSGGPLESMTSAQLDAGGNLAAVGADGRWLIFQYGSAVLDTGDTWTISDFRLGLFGTLEHLDTVVVGDRFVSLSESSVIRIDESPASIGVEKLFKVVTCGQSIDAVDSFAFTTQGLSYQAAPTPPSVISASTSDPPADPANGDAYLIPCDPAASGAWSGHEGELATWSDQANGWVFAMPVAGTLIYVDDTASYIVASGECTTSGGFTLAPWTPAIPPLPEDTAPDFESIEFVAWDPVSETYIKVLLDATVIPDAIGVPLVSFSDPVTISSAHNGRKLVHPSGGGASDTVTIPANSVDPLGTETTVTVINLDTNAVPIAINTDTLILAGSGAVASLTLVQYGEVTLTKVASTTWMAIGVGVS